jgi:hypothetical protein
VPSGRGTLYWKWEDGPPDAALDDPDGVGPAWVIEADGSEREINGGEWITRAEAVELAVSNGWALDADDDSGDARIDAEAPLDVEAVNARLRALGIGPSQLLLLREEDPPGYILVGALAHEGVSVPPLSPWETEASRRSVRLSYPHASAVAARLDELVPGWRNE